MFELKYVIVAFIIGFFSAIILESDSHYKKLKRIYYLEKQLEKYTR